MNLQTKKVIAREFVTLTILLSIGLISFLGTFIYNSILNNKINGISTFITEKAITADSLRKNYNLYANATILKDEFSIPIKSYRLIIAFDEEGLPKPGHKIFPPSSKDTVNYQESLLLKEKIKKGYVQRNAYQLKLLSFNKQVSFTLNVFLIGVILLFGVRYLLYGIRWSIRTLRQKI
jgi:hypothetical protein